MRIFRNEPCPCGSGRKYKKCCLAQDETAAVEQRERARRAAAAEPDDCLHDNDMSDDDGFVAYVEALEKLTNRANDRIRSKQWAEAEDCCSRLIEQFPEEIDGNHRFYEYYKARGDFREARKHAQATLAMVESREGFDPRFPAELKEDIAAFDERIQADRRTD